MNLQITSTSAWNPINARELANLSARAYTEASIFCPTTDTHVLIVELPHCLAIAFRGTSSLRDFLLDADFLRTPLEWDFHGHPAEVHRGFLEAFESILLPLHEYLGKLAPAGRPLFITGHSLGGALAVLCALELKRNRRYDIHSVYTYGQPRIGNSVFRAIVKNSLGDSYHRHVYENDLVARLPYFPSLTDPYRHAGQEIFLPDQATGQPRRIDLNPSTLQLLWQELRHAWRAFSIRHTGILYDALADHHITNYQHALENIEANPVPISRTSSEIPAPSEPIPARQRPGLRQPSAAFPPPTHKHDLAKTLESFPPLLGGEGRGEEVVPTNFSFPIAHTTPPARFAKNASGVRE